MVFIAPLHCDHETEMTINYYLNPSFPEKGPAEMTPIQEQLVFNLHRILQYRVGNDCKVTSLEVNVFGHRLLIFAHAEGHLFLKWNWTIGIGPKGSIDHEYSMGALSRRVKEGGKAVSNRYLYQYRDALEAERVNEFTPPHLVIVS